MLPVDGGTGDGNAQVHVMEPQKDTRMPSLSYLNLEGSQAGVTALTQSLPKVHSNPEISDHIRYYTPYFLEKKNIFGLC
jgi:hypothetical protein